MVRVSRVAGAVSGFLASEVEVRGFILRPLQPEGVEQPARQPTLHFINSGFASANVFMSGLASTSPETRKPDQLRVCQCKRLGVASAGRGGGKWRADTRRIWQAKQE